MAEQYNYSQEVLDYLNKCAELVGRDARDVFHQNVWSEYSDLSIESPIEQLFYTSFKTVMRVNQIDEFLPYSSTECTGMLITPQGHIHPYRVDFHISWFGYVFRSDPLKSVVVECDSQQWHERTEKERRYEKRRDRELARRGLHTFRFTGKEIKENPFNPAIDVINFLTGYEVDTLYSQLTELALGEV